MKSPDGVSNPTGALGVGRLQLSAKAGWLRTFTRPPHAVVRTWHAIRVIDAPLGGTLYLVGRDTRARSGTSAAVVIDSTAVDAELSGAEIAHAGTHPIGLASGSHVRWSRGSESAGAVTIGIFCSSASLRKPHAEG